MRIRITHWMFSLGVAGLAACATPQPGVPAPASSGPKAGGTVNVAVTSDPFNWDLTYTGISSPNHFGTGLAYESLLGFEYGPKVKYAELKLRPELAESWQVSPDARAYTFKLRKGLKFANLPPVNGRDLTADDVKWSIEYWTRTGRLANRGLPKAQFDTFYEGLDGVDTPDASTVVVRFKEGFAPFLNYAASDQNVVVPHEVFDKEGHFKDTIVGSGAYQLDVGESQKGSRWVWKKNPNFWDREHVYIDEARWLVITDNPAAGAAFRTKQVDIFGAYGGHRFTSKEATEVAAANQGAVSYVYDAPAPLHMYINVRRPPFDNQRLRQALSMAIDRDAFIKSFGEGQGGWALAGAMPDTFTQEEIKQILKYDPAAAQKIVGELYPNGLDIELLFPGTGFGQVLPLEVQLMQSQMKRVGVNITLKSMEVQEYLQRTRGNTFDFTLRNKALEGDIDSYLYNVFFTGARTNYGGVSDPDLDKMLLAQRHEADPKKRNELVRQIVQYINERAYNLAVYYGPDYAFWQSYVKEYQPNFGNSAWPLIGAWLDK